MISRYNPQNQRGQIWSKELSGNGQISLGKGNSIANYEWMEGAGSSEEISIEVSMEGIWGEIAKIKGHISDSLEI